MEKTPTALTKEVETLRSEVSELERHFPNWDSGSAAGGRDLRSLAKRISLTAKRLEASVSENTYHAR